MTPVLAYALGAKDAYRAVERRMVDAGCLLELDILHRLSADEVDLLVRLERGLTIIDDRPRLPLGAHPGVAG